MTAPEDGELGPRAAAESPVEYIRQPDSVPATRVHSLHLLDHDSETLLFLFDFLSNAGFKVSASSTVVDAFDYIEREHPDLVITNMEMPGLTSVELLLRLRELAPAARLIMTSERLDWILYEDLLRSGGAFVTKPIKTMSLLGAVERVLGA